MTAFGKILVFMNLLFSVITGALIVFVFTTRANWKTAFDDAKRKAEAAEAAYRSEKSTHENDLKQKDTDIASLRNENKRVSDLLDRSRADTAQARTELEAAKKLTGSDLTSANTLQAELAQIRDERQKLSDEKDVLRTRLVALQKELDEQRRLAITADLQAKTLLQKNGNLLRTVEELTIKLRDAETGGAGESILNPPPKPAPPGVRGEVTEVGSTTTNLVQISIGSNSGLAVGNVLTVYRGGEFLGDLTITNAEPQLAVGKFTPSKRDKKVMKGDKVITSFSGVPQ